MVLPGVIAWQSGDREMNALVFRSITSLPSGKLFIKYTCNPEIAKRLGGVLTCRNLPIIQTFKTEGIRSFPIHYTSHQNIRGASSS